MLDVLTNCNKSCKDNNEVRKYFIVSNVNPLEDYIKRRGKITKLNKNKTKTKPNYYFGTLYYKKTSFFPLFYSFIVMAAK